MTENARAPSTYARIPTIQLWDLLLVPLQGEIEDAMAERLMEDVLGRIHGSNTRGLIVDVTGLWMMDSHLCSLLSNLAEAAAIMGTETILCGLSAEIAMTLQTMGLELRGVTTLQDLGQAIDRLRPYDPLQQGDEDQDEEEWDDAAPVDQLT